MEDQGYPNDQYNGGFYGPGGLSDDSGDDPTFLPLPHSASNPER
jgi:hypothetical protein